MVALGVIEQVMEPTDWCALIVPAEKNYKDEIRVCVDLKGLNKAVKQKRYMLPELKDIAPVLRCFLHWMHQGSFGIFPSMVLDRS